MSATAWATWLDRLESARGQEQVLSSKIRTGNSGAIGTSVFALQQSVSRLKRDFDQLKRSSSTAVTKQEIERRERLLNQLARDQQEDLDMYNSRKTSRAAVSPGAADAPARLLSMQNQIMKDQDQQLDLIGQGVSNLRNYSLTVKDETELHVRLLNEIDDDVSRVTDGLESEARAQLGYAHYADCSLALHGSTCFFYPRLTMTKNPVYMCHYCQVAKQSNNTKLYIIILVLLLILIFLLLAGG